MEDPLTKPFSKCAERLSKHGTVVGHRSCRVLRNWSYHVNMIQKLFCVILREESDLASPRKPWKVTCLIEWPARNETTVLNTKLAHTLATHTYLTSLFCGAVLSVLFLSTSFDTTSFLPEIPQQSINQYTPNFSASLYSPSFSASLNTPSLSNNQNTPSFSKRSNTPSFFMQGLMKAAQRATGITIHVIQTIFLRMTIALQITWSALSALATAPPKILYIMQPLAWKNVQMYSVFFCVNEAYIYRCYEMNTIHSVQRWNL